MDKQAGKDPEISWKYFLREDSEQNLFKNRFPTKRYFSGRENVLKQPAKIVHGFCTKKPLSGKPILSFLKKNFFNLNLKFK